MFKPIETNVVYILVDVTSLGVEILGAWKTLDDAVSAIARCWTPTDVNVSCRYDYREALFRVYRVDVGFCKPRLVYRKTFCVDPTTQKWQISGEEFIDGKV